MRALEARRSWIAGLCAIMGVLACGAETQEQPPAASHLPTVAPGPAPTRAAQSASDVPSTTAQNAEGDRATAGGSVPAGPPPPTAAPTAEPADRVTACQQVVDAICKAHVHCNEGTTYTHPSGRIVHDRPDTVTF